MQSPVCLIIANSGRMLAQMAKADDFLPVVIDLFADQDTCKFAEYVVQVDDLSLSSLQKIIPDILLKYPVSCCVYGSGLECYHNSLLWLEQQVKVLGNTAKDFYRVSYATTFIAALDALSINHPKVIFEGSTKITGDRAEKWLAKPMAGEGGKNVYFISNNERLKENTYWQQYIEGEHYSVLFAASRDCAQIIGFNQQYSVQMDSEPCVLSAIVNNAELPQTVCVLIQKWLNQLTVEFSLVGINSLDFIVKNERCFVLEVNARPSASMQLYKGAFSFHVKPGGRPVQPQEKLTKAWQVIYATKEIVITEAIKWPEWVMDRPKNKVIIGKNQPICSIIASGIDLQAAKKQLQDRQQIIVNIYN